MAYSIEQVQQASRLFFELLRKKTLPVNDPLVSECLERATTFDLLQHIAREGGTRVINSGIRLHLIVDPMGSVFATNYTQMRNKYTKLERKVHMHIVNLIILVFLAEMDQDEHNFKTGQDSMSYSQISDLISSFFNTCKGAEGNNQFSKEWKLDIQAMSEAWNIMYMQTKSQEENDTLTRGGISRLGLIHEAMKVLEDERLVFVQESERRVYPREELYERMCHVFHDVERYQELKKLINQTNTKEGE